MYHLQGAELEPLVSKYLSMCEESQEACAELLLLSQYLCCVFLEALGKPVNVFECLFPSLQYRAPSNVVLELLEFACRLPASIIEVQDSI